MKSEVKNVEAYLAAREKDVRVILEKVRKTIKAAAPNAEEVISYGMPAYKEHGILVYFAANKNHTGLYPTAAGIKEFESELEPYKFSKGAIQFPYNAHLPLKLISRIVKFKLRENVNKLNLTKKKRGVLQKSDEQTDPKSVLAHIHALDPATGQMVNAIRKIILGADPTIGERIKWNNPSFFYTGEMKPFNPKEYKREMAVFNLYKGRIMLVFPSGAKVKDTSGILEGAYKDGRRIVIFEDMADVKAKAESLKSVIIKWIKLVHTN